MSEQEIEKLKKDYYEAKEALNVAARITYELYKGYTSYQLKLKAQELNTKIKKTLLKIQ